MRDTSTYEKTITIESDDVITLTILRDRLERQRVAALKELSRFNYLNIRSTELDPEVEAINRILEQALK